jgi:hypothetical protein
MNDNITLHAYDVLLTTRSSWTGTIEAASPAEAVAVARQIWHSDCPHPFDRAGDDELDSVRLAEPQPPPPDQYSRRQVRLPLPRAPERTCLRQAVLESISCSYTSSAGNPVGARGEECRISRGVYEPPGPGLKRFRVSFDQPVIHTVLVTAPDEETAIDAATDLYIETDGLFVGDPPAGWRVDWGHWEVTDAQEVQS